MSGNLLPVFIGTPLMAFFCWGLTRWFPLLRAESKTHTQSLPLDGLRGLLASSVFFHHAYITYVYLQTGNWLLPAFNDYAQLGPTAVTLFFFTSGFLFWRKALRNPEDLRSTVLLPNRFRRILPAYWLAAISTFLLAAFLTHFRLQESSARVVISALKWFFAGFPGLVSPEINGLDSVAAASTVFWTLRLEWIFYLVLPLLLWFRDLKKLVALLVVVSIVTHLTKSVPPTPRFSVETEILRRFAIALVSGFSVGMIAAYDFWHRRVELWLSGSAASCVGIVLLCLQLRYIPATSSFREPILLIPFFFMVVAGNTFFGVLNSKPMRCLGEISYSIYIFHGIILMLIADCFNRLHPIGALSFTYYWAFVLAIGLAVVFVCTLTYWFVERPFLERKPSRPVAVPISDLGG